MTTFSKEEFWYYAKRAFWVLFAWVLISNAIFFYEYLTLLDNNALASDFDFTLAFTANLVVSIIAGFIGGTFTLNLMEWSLRKYAFGKALIIIALTYIVVAAIVSLIGSAFFYSDYIGKPFHSKEVIAEIKLFFVGWLFIKNIIIWLFIVLGTVIVFMINDKYGPGVFPDYLKGKYFSPKRERRIFMFADIRNATGIAEAIGEEKYFHFLKDFFNDIASPIQKSKGEVYQYVGDEVVITWKMKNGLRKANALRCFYRMRDAIVKKEAYYLKKYGFVPTFKVGLHYGAVMVGELGKIKRDIAFSGDVLNTTARIQACCNENSVDILTSSEFADIVYKLPNGLEKEIIGKVHLRGKSEEITLVTYREQ
ncbi:adenylate/guanylate cyclase domain-containing protein [Dokdonia ponticola]|uniref:Adenylate/guanylate cyclase domain-containing protein n=1 Tax=Dokdonia ponticola TaxID=2041041 RepID=A0ABV9HTH3_9FLAO